MIPYKGYLISGKAVRVNPNSSDGWRSHGDVFVNSSNGSIHIKHLEAVMSSPKKLPKRTALNSAKSGWTKNLEASDDV
jgi:hypothetical protein